MNGAPERQHAPDNLHRGEPYPGRHDLQHQVICPHKRQEVWSDIICRMLCDKLGFTWNHAHDISAGEEGVYLLLFGEILRQSCSDTELGWEKH